jgi:hypothetical protein
MPVSVVPPLLLAARFPILVKGEFRLPERTKHLVLKELFRSNLKAQLVGYAPTRITAELDILTHKLSIHHLS